MFVFFSKLDHVHRDGKLDCGGPCRNKKCLHYFAFAGLLVSIALILSTIPILIIRSSKNRNSSGGFAKETQKKIQEKTKQNYNEINSLCL